MDEHTANRINEVESRQDGKTIKGDFEGSVTGQWKKLAQNGAGTVTYNGKDYETKPIGFTSIAAGTPVEVSHADGVYYSKW